MEQGDGNIGLDPGSDFVHGVGTDDNKVRPGFFQGTGGLPQYVPAPVPVPAGLAFFYFIKVNTVEDALGGVEAAKLFFNGLVDNLIVGDGAFPAHAAD